jgi:hypothetical protein
LSQPIETRDGTLTKDARCVNGYFETTNGKREFVKRPGLTSITTVPALPVAQGQGLTYFAGNLYAAINNVLYQINPTTYAVTTIGTMTGTINGEIQDCYFNQTLNSTYLFVHNQVHGYTYNPATNVFAQVVNTGIVTTTVVTGGSLYSNPTVTFSAPAGGGTTATGTVQSTSGIVTGITITNPGTGYSTTDTLIVTITDTVGNNWAANTTYTAGQTYWTGANLYTVTVSGVSGSTAPTFTSGTGPDGTATVQWLTATNAGGSGAYVTAALNGFPTGNLVPGAPYLDTYTVIASPNGEIFTSNPNNPTSWNALNYITAESDPDTLIGIAKHLNYIVAFGTRSIDWFYDNGNYPGSPLTNAPSYKIELGCANGDSLVSFENTVFWVGTSKDLGPSVYSIAGTAPIKSSTPYIDRILQTSNLTDIRAFSMKVNGHTFYVLTLHDINVTIVFDLNENTWVQWSSWALGDADSGVPGVYAEQYFRPSFFVGTGEIYYLLNDDTGVLYNLSANVYNDDGAPIYYRSVTDLLDSGTTKRKFYQRVEIVGDKIGATMNIRHTDNDYNTWSPYRTVNLSAGRSQIYQTGQARRRAWEFLCTDNAPLRLLAAEVDFNIGELDETSQLGQMQYRV